MSYKLKCFLGSFLVTQIAFAGQTLNLTINEKDFEKESEVEKVEGVTEAPKLSIINKYTLTGYRQAISDELKLLGFDKNNGIEAFWNSVKAKNLKFEKEISYLAPVFTEVSFASKAQTETQSETMSFKYDIDQSKLKKLFAENVQSYVNYAAVNLYLNPEITIDKNLEWKDLGVNSKEDFVNAIVDSWKSWAKEKFPSFENVIVMTSDFKEIPEDLNTGAITIKWSSHIKRPEVYTERISALYSITSQYVVVNTKTNINLLAFDFPEQKSEYSVQKPQELSSKLASFIYNSLNSQTAKISSTVDFNKASSTLHISDFNLKGAVGMSDLTLVSQYLQNKYRAYALESDLKNYSTEVSTLAIRSTADAAGLNKIFALDKAPVSISDNKTLSFDVETNSFAVATTPRVNAEALRSLSTSDSHGEIAE